MVHSYCLKPEDGIPQGGPTCTPPINVILLLREAVMFSTRLLSRQNGEGKGRPELCATDLQPVAVVS